MIISEYLFQNPYLCRQIFFMHYLILVLALWGFQLLYFRLAEQYRIIDKPNERSSHARNTFRGGGVVFVLAMLAAWITGDASWTLALAILLVGVVSMADDIRPMHQLPRFSAHFLAAALLLYGIYDGQLSLWIMPLLLFFLVGWINLFNFMDGINGITVLYALVALGSFALVPEMQEERELIYYMGLSGLVFAFYNVRKKAKTFAGDVGSVAMALLLGYLMIKTIVQTQNPMYLFFFTVYGTDAVWTIFVRLFRKENIFQPHRRHLYQFLANELKYSHVGVSLAYALIQLGINVFWIYGVGLDRFQILPFTVFILVILLIYGWIRSRVVREIKKK